jgi:flagellin-specific chaperone FliS
MKTDEAIRTLKAAMVAIESGNLKAAKELIAKVIAGLQIKRHK